MPVLWVGGGASGVFAGGGASKKAVAEIGGVSEQKIQDSWPSLRWLSPERQWPDYWTVIFPCIPFYFYCSCWICNCERSDVVNNCTYFYLEIYSSSRQYHAQNCNTCRVTDKHCNATLHRRRFPYGNGGDCTRKKTPHKASGIGPAVRYQACFCAKKLHLFLGSQQKLLTPELHFLTPIFTTSFVGWPRPDPIGGAYSTRPDPLAVFVGGLLLKGGKGEEGKGEERKGRREEREFVLCPRKEKKSWRLCCTHLTMLRLQWHSGKFVKTT